MFRCADNSLRKNIQDEKSRSQNHLTQHKKDSQVEYCVMFCNHDNTCYYQSMLEIYIQYSFDHVCVCGCVYGCVGFVMCGCVSVWVL